MAKKKVLLMGKAHSGKTSMRSIIFANYLARDTTRLSPTLDVEHHHVKFLGDLVLNLWDCGGQDAFYESYFERDRETIFRSVELLIYVFDIESTTAEKDFDHFCGVLEAIEENSPEARIFVLVHKMDLVAEEDRDSILDDRKRLIQDSCTSCGVENFHIYGTSIWDETLYKAWSEIVTNLIPNIRLLENHLHNFCRICDADEVVLFERATFLVISSAQASDDEPIIANNNNNNRITNGGTNTTTTTTTSPPNTTENETDEQRDTSNTIPGSDTSTDIVVGASHDTRHVQFTTSDEEEKVNDDGIEIGEVDPSTTSTTLISTKVNGGVDSTLGTTTGTTSSTIVKHRKRTQHFDAHRFEKISNIVKQFKLSCGKAQAQFSGMEVRNSRFVAYIDAFTANTYIMVIVSNPTVHSAGTILNIHNARDHFEKFIPRI